MIAWRFCWSLSVVALLGACDQHVDKPPAAPEVKQEEPKLTPGERLAFAEKCSKDGTAFFIQYRNTNMADGYMWDEPEFHYSAKRNTCLLYARFVSRPPMELHSTTWHENAVIDIFANKVILRGNFERTDGIETINEFTLSDAPNFTSEEFFKRKEILFSE